MASRSKKPQPKMTPAQALEEAKKLALEGRWRPAEATKTQTLETWIHRILDAMRVKRALITDGSLIRHALPRGIVRPLPANDNGYHEIIEEERKYLEHTLGVSVALDDTFVAVAQRMKRLESH